MVKTIVLIIFFISISFAQIKSLSEQELKDELTRCLIERLGYKLQAELTDTLISELQKSQQREWLKDYELRICVDEKINLSQKLLNYDCPQPSWYDKFFYGFLGAGITALIAFIVGVSI